jgi:hypothetical protein
VRFFIGIAVLAGAISVAAAIALPQGTLRPAVLIAPPALFVSNRVLLVIDLGLTLLHSSEELRGKLWRYFGDIVGIKIPDLVGYIFFFAGLTLGLWLVGFFAIGQAMPGLLGLLIGCRVSDGIFSHIVPLCYGYRDNPGIKTVPLYFLEAAFLSWKFYSTLASSLVCAVLGFAAGFLLFFAIIPGLLAFGPRGFKFQPPGASRP